MKNITGATTGRIALPGRDEGSVGYNGSPRSHNSGTDAAANLHQGGRVGGGQENVTAQQGRGDRGAHPQHGEAGCPQGASRPKRFSVPENIFVHLQPEYVADICSKIENTELLSLNRGYLANWVCVDTMLASTGETDPELFGFLEHTLQPLRHRTVVSHPSVVVARVFVRGDHQMG